MLGNQNSSIHIIARVHHKKTCKAFPQKYSLNQKKKYSRATTANTFIGAIIFPSIIICHFPDQQMTSDRPTYTIYHYYFFTLLNTAIIRSCISSFLKSWDNQQEFKNRRVASKNYNLDKRKSVFAWAGLNVVRSSKNFMGNQNLEKFACKNLARKQSSMYFH